jgi:MinD-like ATPase involved in chromosome partitioning or flagellar assembly
MTSAMYTWTDVQDSIEAAIPHWPATLFSARAYWDSVVVEHAEGAREEVETWLSQHFSPRWIANADDRAIRLESASGKEERTIPVLFDESSHDPPRGVQRRSFRQPDTAMRRRPPDAALSDLPVQVFAWHSFKGGVGRTTSAIQFARLLSKRPGATVMLVDMDFEAPGITWMALESRLPFPSIAMSDVLALIHSSSADRLDAVTALVVERLRDSLVDNLLILPALRACQRGPEVRPEHLEVAGGQAMAEALCRISKSLDVTHVIVDLPAGRSEHAASLLLDSRVARVLVTTPAGQSVKGTCEMLAELAEALPDAATDPAITIVVSKLHSPAPTVFETVKNEIVSATEAILTTNSSSDAPFPVRFTATLHDNALLALPLDWTDAASTLDATMSLDVGDLGVDLGFQQWAMETGASVVQEPSATGGSVDDLRERLRDFTGQLVTAEGAGTGPFLDTGFLKKLVQSHRSRLPVVVAEGAKGSGKTFTFLRLMGHKSWKGFAKATSEDAEVDGRVVPLVWSKALNAQAVEAIDTALGGPHTADTALLGFSDQLAIAREAGLSDAGWRLWWLDRMAERVGVPGHNDLSTVRERVVIVLDGIEDLLPSIHSEQVDQRCLRALLQEVPIWLRASTSNMGLIVFARPDYVRAAIPQNTEQFRSVYRAFELRWDRNEALRLVRWTAEQAGVITSGKSRDPAEDLLRIWGRKLGTDKSREAITQVWVMDALSTRKEEVQARDLVRLLAESAGLSIGMGWEDRILAPQAIRDALEKVGIAKIAEITEELGDALERFKTLGAEIRVPFRIGAMKEDASRLALSRLEASGIAWRDGEDYWLVSLYRRGLRIQLQPGRRERVLR